MVSIIVDDNKIARVTIKQLTTQVPDLEDIFLKLTSESADQTPKAER